MKARTAVQSAFEWITAAGIVLAGAWLSSDVARIWMGPNNTLVLEGQPSAGPGVPAGTTSVSLLVLLDGREIRTGLTHAQLESLLPKRQAVQKPVVTTGSGGNRLLQAYADSGRTFFVACERSDSTGVMRVAGVYLP